MPEESTFGAFVSVIRSESAIDPSFCFYQFIGPIVQARIRFLASTTTNISNISSGKLKKTLPRLMIPPLNEQRRIVAKIEELFTKLDAGVEALERAQQLLKRYRQSVLKAAVEGKLTEQWRENTRTRLNPPRNC